MATSAKKKTTTKKKTALKKSNKVNPTLIIVGTVLAALVGALVVGMSFAGTRWPGNDKYAGQWCGITAFTAAYSPSFPTLKAGNVGPCVITLKKGMQRTGFFSTKYATDAVFGPKTRDSVVLMQTYYKLRAKDGIVGKCTWYALQGANNYGRDRVGTVQNYVKSQTSGCF